MSQILKKSHDKSFMKSFHIDSPYAQTIFNEGSNKFILQVMKLSEEIVIAEVVYKEDYHA